MSTGETKDKGGFTDDAIEAVEYELTRLAEQIGVTEEELLERISDATHRQDYDFIEIEIITMRQAAIDMVHERTRRWQAQIEGNLTPTVWLMLTTILCGGAAIMFVIRSWMVATHLLTSYLMSAAVFGVLMIMMMVASIHAQAINQTLMKGIKENIPLARGLLESCNELIESTRDIILMPDGRVILPEA